MVNKNLFNSAKVPAQADTTNHAGGAAYSRDAYNNLAQIAATNCFNGTFYSDANSLLTTAKEAVLKLKNDPEFLAKVAIYSRDRNHMKDMPAFITTMLADIDTKLFRKVFAKVITNGKMLRNAIQMARSGQCGRKFNMSAGAWRRAIQNWFDVKSPEAIFRAGIGNDPSMRDILRMSHVKPNTPEKAALFAYLVGSNFDATQKVYKQVRKDDKGNTYTSHEHSFNSLPEVVRQYENYKTDKSLPVPNVDFRYLDSLGLDDKAWETVARNAGWMMTRMNLNTFLRHNVFNNNEVLELIVNRLKSQEEIKKAKQFPYQIFKAWYETKGNDAIPQVIKSALVTAMENAIANVPSIAGKVVVAIDRSGSMSSPITGYRGTATSNVSCNDVASLIGCSILRKNSSADIYTFDSRAVKVQLTPEDTVLTNTAKIMGAGGGTDISSVLRHMNEKNLKADLVIHVSDNESWLDRGYWGASALVNQWDAFKKRNPNAQMVCIDLTPNSSQPVNNRKDVLQVGGWSDAAFDVIAAFATAKGNDPSFWVSEIQKISLDDVAPEETPEATVE